MGIKQERRLAEIVKKHEPGILADWLKEQLAAVNTLDR